MAADQTLVEGAYRANRFFGQPITQAQKNISESIYDLDKPGLFDEENFANAKQEKPTKPAAEEEAKTKEVADTDASTDTDTGEDTGKKTDEDLSFDDAFAEARKKHGGDGGTFVWNGKTYTTDVDNNENKSQADEETNNVAVNETGVTEGDTDMVVEGLKDSQLKFSELVLNNDKAGQAKLLTKLKSDKEALEGFDSILLGVNEDYLAKGENTQYGYGNALTSNPKALEYVQSLIKAKDGLKLTKETTYPNEEKPEEGVDQFVVKGPDGQSFSYQQLEKYLSQFEVANDQFNEIYDFAKEQRKLGGTETGPYDKDAGIAKAQQIVDSGDNNLISMALDKSFGNTSFYQDFIASDKLSGITYESLGLKPPKGDDGNIDAKDSISDEMKKQIVSAMINDSKNKDLLKGELVNYIAGHFERNYNVANPLSSSNMGGMRDGTGNGMPNLFPGQTVGDKSYAPTYTMSVDDLTNIE